MSNLKRTQTWTCTLLAASLAALWAIAGEKIDDARSAGDFKLTKAEKKAARVARGDKSSAFTPEREAAARTFVHSHHPELESLLDRLKSKQPEQYRQAIRELFQTSETLTELQARDPRRYQLALETWKAKSRADVLTARLKASADPKLEAQLKEVLERQFDLQVQQQELEKEVLKARLERIDSQIQKMKNQKAKRVEQRLQLLAKERKTPKARKAVAKKVDGKEEFSTGPKSPAGTPQSERSKQ